jgi:hypothetical protein
MLSSWLLAGLIEILCLARIEIEDYCPCFLGSWVLLVLSITDTSHIFVVALVILLVGSYLKYPNHRKQSLPTPSASFIFIFILYFWFQTVSLLR